MPRARIRQSTATNIPLSLRRKAARRKKLSAEEARARAATRSRLRPVIRAIQTGEVSRLLPAKLKARLAKLKGADTDTVLNFLVRNPSLASRSSGIVPQRSPFENAAFTPIGKVKTAATGGKVLSRVVGKLLGRGKKAAPAIRKATNAVRAASKAADNLRTKVRLNQRLPAEQFQALFSKLNRAKKAESIARNALKVAKKATTPEAVEAAANRAVRAGKTAARLAGVKQTSATAAARNVVARTAAPAEAATKVREIASSPRGARILKKAEDLLRDARSRLGTTPERAPAATREGVRRLEKTVRAIRADVRAAVSAEDPSKLLKSAQNRLRTATKAARSAGVPKGGFVEVAPETAPAAAKPTPAQIGAGVASKAPKAAASLEEAVGETTPGIGQRVLSRTGKIAKGTAKGFFSPKSFAAQGVIGSMLFIGNQLGLPIKEFALKLRSKVGLGGEPEPQLPTRAELEANLRADEDRASALQVQSKVQISNILRKRREGLLNTLREDSELTLAQSDIDRRLKIIQNLDKQLAKMAAAAPGTSPVTLLRRLNRRAATVAEVISPTDEDMLAQNNVNNELAKVILDAAPLPPSPNRPPVTSPSPQVGTGLQGGSAAPAVPQPQAVNPAATPAVRGR